ncbi:MAG: stage III sporulation protein AF [Firmicutes bacterium]|nr:stage III sporulation protein AF [Bacillota bacterium]
MSTWLLSIAGVVVVGVLVDLLLTDSHVSKFVRAIYGFFILFVIVSPLPGLIGGGLEVGGFEPDQGIVGSINAQSLQAAQVRVDRALANAEFGYVLVMIIPDSGSTSFRIDRVFVTGGGLENQDAIIRIVRTTLNIDERRIVYHA